MGLNLKPWHILSLEYFRSFVHLEDFIPQGCSLRIKTSYLLAVTRLFLV